MKRNKAPGPDSIPIVFYKAFFCNHDLEEKFPFAGKCLKIIFNKIWEGSFPNELNSASIVSIPKKGDLSNCNNYRGISLLSMSVLKFLQKLSQIESLNMLLNIILLDLNSLAFAIMKNVLVSIHFN